MQESNETRAGFVALIGEPNAGKSTLMNHLVGAKVSIVTHKVQTTRAPIRGIALHDESQIIFIDTPGLFKTQSLFERAMVASAWNGAGDADITVLLIEAHRKITSGVERILKGLHERQAPSQKVILAINKIDKVKSEELLALSQKLNAAFPFQESFFISAQKGYGTKDLMAYLANHLPLSPWLYDKDQIADVPLRLLSAEVTREKLMLRLHQEIPYQTTVETERWEDQRNGAIRIEQMIYVTRKGHKGIILGAKGQTIKAISMASRKELEEILERKIHLFLQIKHRPNWMREKEHFAQIGLDYPPPSR